MVQRVDFEQIRQLLCPATVPNFLILDGNQMRMLFFPFSLVLVSDNHKIWSNSPPTLKACNFL